MLLGCGLHFFLFVIIGDPNLLYFTRCQEFSNVRGKAEEKPTLVAVSIISVLFGWDVQFAWLRVVHGGVYLSRSIGALDQDPMMLQILIATDPGLHLFADGDW